MRCKQNVFLLLWFGENEEKNQWFGENEEKNQWLKNLLQASNGLKTKNLSNARA